MPLLRPPAFGEPARRGQHPAVLLGHDGSQAAAEFIGRLQLGGAELMSPLGVASEGEARQVSGGGRTAGLRAAMAPKVKQKGNPKAKPKGKAKAKAMAAQRPFQALSRLLQANYGLEQLRAAQKGPQERLQQALDVALQQVQSWRHRRELQQLLSSMEVEAPEWPAMPLGWHSALRRLPKLQTAWPHKASEA